MNKFKRMLKEGKTVKGIWLMSGSHIAAEIAGISSFDWALIDLEHGFGSDQEALHILQALSSSSTSPIVRVPSSSSDQVKRVLDFGAGGIMAPMVNNEKQAEDFVRSLKYPPEGRRGLTGASRASGYGNNFKEYFSEINESIISIVQIETQEAVENVDKIAALDSVDILFVGHSDLSLNLGCFGDFENPVFIDAEKKILAACKKYGKTAGMLLKTSMGIEEYTEKGYTFIAMGTDIGCLKNSFKNMLN